ncbi:MAG: cysteine desulfurase NifS [Candidatus Altiarchaeales archaeon]|nr:MAG: cysteine desulfurase NifS [Candidatus Altiarchaeales archaeon]
MRRIYLDHAATTPIDSEVVEEMLPYFTERFGNASSSHSLGREAKIALENSREKIAEVINSEPEEILFTSGGTESNNLAIKGVAHKSKKGHIITSVIEHHAVLNPCRYLEGNGFRVTYLPVDEYGLIDLKELENSITEDTILISIMHANNEIGTVQEIEKIGEIARERGVYFHTDAVQSVGKIPIDVKRLNIDLLSISSHKMYGPKGVGALYVKKGIEIEPILHGGGHEFGLRSGTENVPGIVGFAKAAELSLKGMNRESNRLMRLRDKLIDGVLEIEGSRLNGHPRKRLPNNANFSFGGIKGNLLQDLDVKGILASSGSACSSHSSEPSHVLTAIGLSEEEANASLRLTLGRDNTEEDIEYVLRILPGVIRELRR